MKHILSRLFAALTITGGIFANGSGEAADAETSAETVEIDFWTIQTQSDRLAAYQVLVDTFRVLNPDISVNVIPVDEEDMANQMNSSAVADTLPAIIEGPAANAVTFGSAGLLNTAAAAEVINGMGADKFYSGVLKLSRADTAGAYYCVPYHGWVQGIWYRADWFEEAGLNPPETWEDILKAAEYFYDPASNQYGVLIGTKEEFYAEQVFTQFAMSNDAGLFDAEGNLIFNSPEMKETLEYYAELAQYNPPGPQTWRARDYYLQGKMAMFFYSTYIIDDLALAEVAAKSLTSENFADLAGAGFDPELAKNTRMAPLVTKVRSSGYGHLDSLAFPETGDPAKTAAARRFAEYLFSPNSYITVLHMAPGGMIPVLKDIAANPRFQADPKNVLESWGTDKMAEIIGGLDSIESFGMVEGRRIDAAALIYSRQIIPRMIYKVTQEGESVDTAMAWAEEEMRKLL